jgi:hypothetical protein
LQRLDWSPMPYLGLEMYNPPLQMCSRVHPDSWCDVMSASACTIKRWDQKNKTSLIKIDMVAVRNFPTLKGVRMVQWMLEWMLE